MSSQFKLVVIGDGAVGKTCLLVVYLQGRFPADYVPTVFENYSSKVNISGKEYQMNLWDTAGQEDLGSLRTLSYPDTDVFLVCFSVVDPSSFENVSSKWIPELKEHAPKHQILLVGTKTDLRDDQATIDRLNSQGQKPITTQQGVDKAIDIGAVDYVECSALKMLGVKDVFDRGIVAAINPPTESCCSVL